ncbi:hypothetical protein TWF225_004402 [Orbilia oligospora]|nr:hypothetical protein TWF225_004402 [Orbilia oligospora]KAF3260048.1 hypothetical protein TWF217_005071 [Orbilia oligospora]KAF3267131.1 hypothetical protein TWF128_010082 [Orbilia oligospora]
MIFHKLLPFLTLLLYLAGVQAQAKCSAKVPCKVGCCSKYGNCGFGPDFCGTGCLNNCNAKAECGKDAPAGKKNCPLNVCCSKYGFCGLTKDFCSKSAGCQSNCDTPAPKCAANALGPRRVGYYESWATTRRCAAVPPAKIRTTGLTHLIYSFASIDPHSFQIAPTSTLDAQLFGDVTALKKTSPTLKVFIAVGGWAFNDPGPTRETFSKMVSTARTRKIFIDSVVLFIKSYGFDGIDIDWEYPGASDRGGKPADTENYVLLVREMRQAFTAEAKGWGISIAIPASYWYLQHFNLSAMARYIDWFNLMSYDFVGAWDATNKWTGPYIGAHTNLTMTQQALDLMSRSKISGSKINMGLGFYGRSFTLKNKACTKPGCQFSKAGKPGRCSAAAGILMNIEIQDIQKKKKIKPVFDKVAGVKYMSWDDQWVSFDDAESIAFKRHWAGTKCLGGLMIWALDHDTLDNVGLAAAIGVTPTKFVAMAATQERPPRTNCYIAFCGDNCVAGYSVFGYGSGSFSSTDALGLRGSCDGGKFSSICCPSNSMTKNPLDTCRWVGNEDLVGVVGPGPSRKRAGPAAPGLCKVGCPAGMTEIVQNTVTSQRRVTRFDEQWTYGYCLEGYASYCCPDFTVDAKKSPPLLFYEDRTSLRKRGLEFLLAPLFGYGIMFKKLYIDPEPIFKPLKIGIDIGGKEVAGFPALPTDERPWDEFVPDPKDAPGSSSSSEQDRDSTGDYSPSEQDSEDESSPTWVPYHLRDTVAGHIYGGHVAVASRRPGTTKDLTYICTYTRFPQVCENIRSAILVRGAPSVVNYLHNMAPRVIPRNWARQHGARNNPQANQHSNPWLVYTIRPQTFVRIGANGAAVTRTRFPYYPTCEVDEYPFHSTSQNIGPIVVGRLVPREQNQDQGQDWRNFLIANRVSPVDRITVTWLLPRSKLDPHPWHSRYDLGQNAGCFPARNHDPNSRIFDPVFAVMTDDPFVASVHNKLNFVGGYHNTYRSEGLAIAPTPTDLNFLHLGRRDMMSSSPPIPVQTRNLLHRRNPSHEGEGQPVMMEPIRKIVTVPVISPTSQPTG